MKLAEAMESYPGKGWEKQHSDPLSINWSLLCDDGVSIGKSVLLCFQIEGIGAWIDIPLSSNSVCSRLGERWELLNSWVAELQELLSSWNFSVGEGWVSGSLLRWEVNPCAGYELSSASSSCGSRVGAGQIGPPACQKTSTHQGSYFALNWLIYLERMFCVYLEIIY